MTQSKTTPETGWFFVCPEGVYPARQRLWLTPGCESREETLQVSTKTLPPGGSCHPSALRNRWVTDEECGRKSEMRRNVQTYSRASAKMSLYQVLSLYEPINCRPNSSPDPLRGPPSPRGRELGVSLRFFPPRGQDEPPSVFPAGAALAAGAETWSSCYWYGFRWICRETDCADGFQNI